MVPYPAIDEQALIGGLQRIVGEQQKIVRDAKVNIKIACRGGRRKPWLGNPALKAQSLEILRAAKREEGRCTRLIYKIQTEMKWIWGKMDTNAKLAADKRLAKEEALYQREMAYQAKQQRTYVSQMNKLQTFQKARGQRQQGAPGRNTRSAFGGSGGSSRHRNRHHAYDCQCHQCYCPGVDSTDLEDEDEYDFADADACIAADMTAEDLAILDPEQQADLADVQGYAGAGPQDLGDGGGANMPRDPHVVAGCRALMSCKARVSIMNNVEEAERQRRLLMDRQEVCKARVSIINTVEEAERQRRLLMDRQEDLIRGTSALSYRLIPRFLQHDEDVDSHQVTLVTQCSMDRLPRLQEQVLALGNAPISAAIYVPYDAAPLCAATSNDDQAERVRQQQQEALADIRRLHSDLASKGSRRVSIAILFGNMPSDNEYDNMYPINNLRNLALRGATTELVFLVDVDFVPSPGLARLCAGQELSHYNSCHQLCKGGAVLVVPAFEVDSKIRDLPKTPAEMMALCGQQRAEGFHVSSFPKGHTPTDFERWFESREPYNVEYEEMFEPYIICERETVPRYDERFRGYGMNKISHLHEVAATGVQFVVLPIVFVTARQHGRSESYERVFGEQRDPQHAVRISLLWGSFKRQVREKYAASNPAHPPPPPPYRSLAIKGEEHEGAASSKADSSTAPTACKWLFYATRKPVRVAGLRRRQRKNAHRTQDTAQDTVRTNV